MSCLTAGLFCAEAVVAAAMAMNVKNSCFMFMLFYRFILLFGCKVILYF